MDNSAVVKNFIKSGLQLWVKVKGTQKLFFTRVSNVYDTSFTIFLPTDNGKNVVIPQELELEFIFTSENCKYIFSAKQIGIVDGDITLLTIELPVTIQKSEVRAFKRVEMFKHIPVKLIDITNGLENNKYKKNDIVMMICTDLSGGGIKLISPVYLEKDDLLEINLSKFVEGLENVEAKVTRHVGIEKGGEGYITGVMFTSLTETDRNKIIRGIFQHQFDKERLIDSFRRNDVF